MKPDTRRWWRLITGVTTVALAFSAAACEDHATNVAAVASPCVSLPPSDVPSIAKALTQTDAGTYCAATGTTVLIALKATDFTSAAAWSQPRVEGPAGGVQWLSAPITALRGTTIAALRLAVPGTYRFAASTQDRAWNATIRVSAP